MDFELNKSVTPAPTGSPTWSAPQGDLLLEYAIDQGGRSRPSRPASGPATAWGPQRPLSGQAIGTINQVPILAARLGRLGAPMTARTFGEMSLDLDFIFDSGNVRVVRLGNAQVPRRPTRSRPS